MSSIRGNRSNLLPLHNIHFNFQPLFNPYAYCWDPLDYTVSLKSSVITWHQFLKTSTQMYTEICDFKYSSTYLCVRSHNLLWLVRT